MIFGGGAMAQDDIPYGTVKTVEELGRLVRAHRKHRHLTLETVSASAM